MERHIYELEEEFSTPLRFIKVSKGKGRTKIFQLGIGDILETEEGIIVECLPGCEKVSLLKIMKKIFKRTKKKVSAKFRKRIISVP